MLWGMAIDGKRYSLTDWAVAAAVTAGVMQFLVKGPTGSYRPTPQGAAVSPGSVALWRHFFLLFFSLFFFFSGRCPFRLNQQKRVLIFFPMATWFLEVTLRLDRRLPFGWASFGGLRSWPLPVKPMFRGQY